MDDGCLKRITKSHLKILSSTRWQAAMTEECWFCMKIVWEFTTLRWSRYDAPQFNIFIIERNKESFDLNSLYKCITNVEIRKRQKK